MEMTNQEYYHYNSPEMVKSSKISKPRRTSSMERCVADAQEFLGPSKAKKILKTKTMARTIEQGKAMLAPVPKKPLKKKAAKKSSRPTRPARPSLPAVPAVVPASTGSTIIRARSLDRSIKPTKATIFKTKSKDLPLPAFGFVDVCFCVDATGSMSG